MGVRTQGKGRSHVLCEAAHAEGSRVAGEFHKATEETSVPRTSKVQQYELKDPRGSYRLRKPQSRRLRRVKSSQSVAIYCWLKRTMGNGGFQLCTSGFLGNPNFKHFSCH